jgi:hypothetical protein
MTMGTPKAITWGAVERYQRLREVSRKLMNRMTKTIPRVAMEEIGEALGIMRKGALVYDTEDVIAVHADCCLHDWIRDGKNLVTKYSLAHPASPGTDEELILRSQQQARFRILLPQSVAAGAGMECIDALSGEHLFLMDIAFSSSVHDGGPVMAARTVPLGDFWMTTGAGLPITGEKAGNEVIGKVRSLLSVVPSVNQHEMALSILRTCLDCGAAEYITYSGPSENEDAQEVESKLLAPRQPATSRRALGRNAPCPCGSGKKYKHCCLRR